MSQHYCHSNKCNSGVLPLLSTMGVFNDLHTLPIFTNSVLTVGTFDGVHKGHQSILKEVVEQAKASEGESILITFHPHPRQLLFPDQPLGIITPLADKLKLIQETGIDHVVVVPFTQQFSSLSAEDYIDQFLTYYFHPKRIVIGYDHRFGHDRAGDIQMLIQHSHQSTFTVVEIPARLIDEAAISSTRIRKAIEEGRVADAAGMLGRHFHVTGNVVHGKKLGRTIGYPTANIEQIDTHQAIPAIGVYAVRVIVNNTYHNGMMSIGYNPTVTDEKTIKLEVNIFDFSNDIYDAEMQVFFIEKIREEQRFDNLDALVNQLHDDKIKANRIHEQQFMKIN